MLYSVNRNLNFKIKILQFCNSIVHGACLLCDMATDSLLFPVYKCCFDGVAVVSKNNIHCQWLRPINLITVNNTNMDKFSWFNWRSLLCLLSLFYEKERVCVWEREREREIERERLVKTIVLFLHFKIDIRSITLNAWSYTNFETMWDCIHTKTVDEKQENSEKRAKEEILRKFVIKTPKIAIQHKSQSMMV